MNHRKPGRPKGTKKERDGIRFVHQDLPVQLVAKIKAGSTLALWKIIAKKFDIEIKPDAAQDNYPVLPFPNDQPE